MLQLPFEQMSEIRIRIQNSLKKPTKKKQIPHLNILLKKSEKSQIIDNRQLNLFEFLKIA